MLKHNTSTLSTTQLIEKRKKMIRKRAQEEIVGFVLIIVLVAVIALLFLAFSIRRPVEMQESREIEDFLHSSLSLTTDCKPSEERVYDLRDLIGACYNNEKCFDDKSACNVLNKTAFELIENSFQVGEEARYKSYNFRIYFQNTTLLYLSSGEETGSKSGAEIYIPISRENFYIRLEVSKTL